MFKTIYVQQPQPNDIVGARVLIAGQATGFEATVRARVRDGNGRELAWTMFMSGAGDQKQEDLHVPLPARRPQGG